MAPRKEVSQSRSSAHPLRVAVKLVQHAAKGLKELQVTERLLEERLGRKIGALPLLPLIESVDPKRLIEMVDRARRTDSAVAQEQLDFSNWYQIVTPEGVNPDELARALRQLEMVETAYVMRPLPPPVDPTDDPRYGNQGYLGAAPNAIDATYAWGFAGGDGAGI